MTEINATESMAAAQCLGGAVVLETVPRIVDSGRDRADLEH